MLWVFIIFFAIRLTKGGIFNATSSVNNIAIHTLNSTLLFINQGDLYVSLPLVGQFVLVYSRIEHSR